MRVTASVAMLPAAPGRTSTRNCWPSFSVRNCAIRRAMRSDALPAAWPTMIFTGRDGYVCARAKRATAGSAAVPAAKCKHVRRESFILNLSFYFRLLDHLVGAAEQRQRKDYSECFCGFQVEDQLNFGYLLDRQVGRFFALENAPSINASQAIRLRDGAAVTHQAAGRGEFRVLVDRRHPVAGR